MRPERSVFILSLVVALLLGLAMGWWLRSDDSVESRAHRAAEHLRGAIRSLTR
jgi:hypothetical protein